MLSCFQNDIVLQRKTISICNALYSTCVMCECFLLQLWSVHSHASKPSFAYEYLGGYACVLFITVLLCVFFISINFCFVALFWTLCTCCCLFVCARFVECVYFSVSILISLCVFIFFLRLFSKHKLWKNPHLFRLLLLENDFLMNCR